MLMTLPWRRGCQDVDDEMKLAPQENGEGDDETKTGWWRNDDVTPDEEERGLMMTIPQPSCGGDDDAMT